ncbi:MAG: 16S rRNA (adenine(1518)-N(6)/adenine(1519)-N(6))-dimethyltransferase RsmA [Bdellovibrionota bacterium]
MPAHGKRRAFGQHFLRDRAICDQIAEAAIAGATKYGCKSLLEIGPGKGAITIPILERLKGAPEIQRFFVSERDEQFVADWKAAELEVEAGDFLDLPEERWLSAAPLAVASNLPYSAGTAIATRLAAHPEAIPFMVLMFQAEVAQRLRAETNTKSWGSLSVWIQNRWDVRKLVSVPPGAFVPRPEVNSEVVILERREHPRVPVARDPKSEALWEKLLKACFAHRRKMLRSGLSSSKLFQNSLERAAVDGTKRAEALQWEEWARLYDAALHLEAT